MPKVTHRLDRVGEMVQREIAHLLATQINDPRVKGVTITRVKMSPDLGQAKVYFTLLPEHEKNITIAAMTKSLNHTVSFLRRRLADALVLRVVPSLHFYYDQHLRDSEHLFTLLNQLEKQAKLQDFSADTQDKDKHEKS